MMLLSLRRVSKKRRFLMIDYTYTNTVVKMQTQLGDNCGKEFFQHYRGHSDGALRFFLRSYFRAMQDGVASILNNSNLLPEAALGTGTTKFPKIYTTKFRENMKQEIAVLVTAVADGQICDEACR